jgi:hypothetical protein
MQTKPISFKPHEVIGTLDGRQTQFRRAMKPQPPTKWGGISERFAISLHCPFGQVGDRLWIRETWQEVDSSDGGYYRYGADYNAESFLRLKPWKPSIHMPRSASRILLEITGIRIERLQEISGQDVLAEGIDNGKSNAAMGRRWENMQIMAFRDFWNSIYSNWDANPWVWVVEFSNLAIADKEESQ